MPTLCIRYTLDISKTGDFETYARGLLAPIARCGGTVVGYYMPTKFAGPTNVALALIDFPSLGAYETFREKLLADAPHEANLRRAEAAGCILNEERSFLRMVTAATA